jgi:hypothetical protein
MPTIASVVLVLLMRLVVPQPHVRIDLAFEAPSASQRLTAAAMEEVIAIWAAYDVDIRALGPNDTEREGATRLTVVLAERPSPPIAPDALGSILFRDERPRPTIVMYPAAIGALVSRTPMPGPAERDWPPTLRDLIVGCVLGRALAHEIGHFLLRSRRHSAAGLMRARQSAYDLVSADRHAFTLTADEEARSRERRCVIPLSPWAPLHVNHDRLWRTGSGRAPRALRRSRAALRWSTSR